MRKAVIFIISILLAGCATGPYPVTSPYFRIPEGSRLLLKQSLTIPPNSARVYIQYGKVVTPKEKDQYYAHCWFLSSEVVNTAQIIKPDIFIVTKTQKFEDVVQRQGTYLLASLASRSILSSDGGPTAVEYTTRLSIHSANQPNIIQFVCSYWEDPVDAKHLTVAEIQKVLGDMAELKVDVSL